MGPKLGCATENNRPARTATEASQLDADCTLAQRFLKAIEIDSPLQTLGSFRTDLEAVLRDLVQRAQVERPEVALAPATFTDRLAHALSATGFEGGLEDIRALVAPDAWLAYACLENNQVAQRQLHAALNRVAALVRGVNDLHSAERADFVQHILTLLLVGGEDAKGPKLARYTGRGPLNAWLRVVAIRAAGRQHHRRARSREMFHEGLEEAFGIDENDPELLHIKAECRNAVRSAFRAALQKLDDRDRVLLRHWILDGMTAVEAAERLGVQRKTVGAWLNGIRITLLKNTRLEMAKELALKREDAESVLRALDSSISISLSAELGGYDPKARCQGRTI